MEVGGRRGSEKKENRRKTMRNIPQIIGGELKFIPIL